MPAHLSRLNRLLRSAAVVLSALLIALTALVTATPQQAAAAPASSTKPAGSIFTDPWTWAAWAVSHYRSSAPSVSVIADTPQSRWFGAATRRRLGCSTGVIDCWIGACSPPLRP